MVFYSSGKLMISERFVVNKFKKKQFKFLINANIAD